MKLLKKTLALLLCLLLVASCCMLSVSADTQSNSTIYFEVPSDWNNWNNVYCHIFPYGGDPLANWQSKKERCTQVEGNLYAYDTSKVGGIEADVTYCVIMSLDIGMETYSTVFTTACLGDTLYCDDTIYENPVDSNKTSRAAFWKNQDPTEFGPLLQITSIGNVVGTCVVESAPDMFYNFLVGSGFENAQIYSGKTDQEIIDDTISALGIEKEEAAEIIDASGVHVEWFSEPFLESIEVKPVSFIERTNGYIDEDYDEEIDYWVEYYRYSDFYDIEYTLTFKDGTVISDTGTWFEYDGWDFDIDISTDQSYKNQWTAGNTYEATASVLGVSTTFPVTIEKSPIKSIEVKPVSFSEGTGGYYDADFDVETEEYNLEYYRYTDFDNIEYTVTYNDGTSQSYTGTWFEYKGTFFDIELDYYQSYENPWTAGNTYEATASVLGVSTTFPVTIEKSPVKSFEIKPFTLTEGIDSIYSDSFGDEIDYYHRYEYYDEYISYTITFNDGTTLSGTNTTVEYKGETYYINLSDNQSYESQWKPGNTYKIEARFMGVTCEPLVTIEENPVTSIDVIKQPDKTEFDHYEEITPQGAVLRINYNDGTYEDVTLGIYNPMSGNYVYINRFNKTFRWDVFVTEDNACVVSLLDNQADIKTTISDKEITSISIEDKNAQLYITLKYNDNSSKVMKALGIDVYMGGGNGDDWDIIGGPIFTDNGTYFGCFNTNLNTGEFYVSIDAYEDPINSNTLDSCVWWEMQNRFSSIAYALERGAGDLKTFDGTVNSTNIDTLLRIACYNAGLLWDKDNIVSEQSNSTTFKADAVKQAFTELYGLTPNLSLSTNYDAENNTVKINWLTGKGGEPYEVPFVVTNENNTYTATIYWGTRTYIITIDDEFSLIEYQITSNSGILGDANVDNSIDIKDATAIQKHLAKLEILSSIGTSLADADGDNEVTIKDATAIQKHIAGIAVDFPIGK